MNKILKISLIIFVLLYLSASSDEFIDKPIELNIQTDCKFSEFCNKYIDDLNIEEYLRKEMKADYKLVSLDECLEVALLNNFDIKINQKIYKRSGYEYKNALSKFLPSFFTTSYIADYQGQLLVGGILRDYFHETVVSVNLTAEHDLTQGGKTIFQAKALKYMQKSRKHELNFSISKVIFLTVKYYYEMLLAKINIEIYLRNLIERNAQLVLARQLKDSGMGTKFDVVRSQNEAAEAKITLLKSLNDFRISQSRLANILGIEVDAYLMPYEDEAILLKLIETKTTLNDLFDLALANREDIKAYKDIISFEKQNKNVIKTEFVPKPLLNFQQQFQGTIGSSIKPNQVVAGYIEWQPGENIFMGTITKLKAQTELIKQRKLELENKIRFIYEEIVSSYSSSDFYYKKISIAKKRVEFSNESVKLAMLRFNLGKGILLDVIEAQGEVTQARVEYINSIIYYNISQAQLLYECGIIDENKIIKAYNP